MTTIQRIAISVPTRPSVTISAGRGGGNGTITSVNGDAGPAVVLDWADVGAEQAGVAQSLIDALPDLQEGTNISFTGTAPVVVDVVDSPTFTGTVTIPTGAVLNTPASVNLTNGTSLPQSGVTGLTSALSAKAPVASPTFTGTVTIPTGAVINTPASVDLTNGTNLPQSGVSGLSTALSAKAPLASPTFTGTVTIPNGSSLGTPASIDLTNATNVPGNALSYPALRVNYR